MLVLGSASPRRSQLLCTLGAEFAVEASDIPEVPRARESALAFAFRAAREKAEAVARRCPGKWVLAADTVVVVDGDILGKPADAADAAAMLGRLSGRCHSVITGVALADSEGALAETFAVESVVEFRPLQADEIEAYVATDEPFDKAGAYAIQGGAARFVTSVSGSYTNVIGLPIDEVRALLERHGLLAVSGDRDPARESR
jgi:nucleoside triphosphate pyrophosphatase